MKLIHVYVLIIFVLLFSTAFASDFVLNVSGRTVNPSGEMEILYGIDAHLNDEYLPPSESSNLQEDGSFLFQDIEFDKDDKLSIVLASKCVYHWFFITYNGTEFEVTDVYADTIIKKTTSENIDLGDLIETSSGDLFTRSDTPVKLELYTGNKARNIGGQSNYRTEHTLKDVTLQNTDYFIIMETQSGDKIEKSFTTSEYCEGTLLTNSWGKVSVDYCTNNECKPQGIPFEWIIGITGIIIVMIIAIVILKRKKS
jgi:hypothetical protein